MEERIEDEFDIIKDKAKMHSLIFFEKNFNKLKLFKGINRLISERHKTKNKGS